MKLDYNVRNMEEKGARRSKYIKIIEQFVKSKAPLAEVKFDASENMESAYTTFITITKRSGAPVKVSKRNGHVYLLAVNNYVE